MKQKIYADIDSHKNIKIILEEILSKKFMLVCDSSFEHLPIKNFFDTFNIPYIKFNEFTPNPLYEDVYKGIKLFNSEKCDAIVAVGGGSTIDVAKCIKLYCKMNDETIFLKQKYNDTKVPLIAVPTTAGTGSESTRYAVIYFEGKKQSVTHESIIPDYAILDHCVLKTLPNYQKKCTMLDALCQGIESWWSVNSTDESKEYSEKAIKLIMDNKDAYINDNSEIAAKNIMLASNFAGRAINITQTTAAHAMSYKLTSMFKLPHGHAVAICLPEVWEYMLKNLNNCIDSRGMSYLSEVFKEIAHSLNYFSPTEAIVGLRQLLKDMNIKYPVSGEKDIDVNTLVNSVNIIRLSNNPIVPDKEALSKMYERIVM